MQAVDVLRQHAHHALFAFERGNQTMCAVGTGTAAIAFNFGDVLPRNIRPPRHHLTRQGLLYGQPFGGQALVIEATNATIGRQAGVGRNTCSGYEKDALRLRQKPCDAIDGIDLHHARGRSAPAGLRGRGGEPDITLAVLIEAVEQGRTVAHLGCDHTALSDDLAVQTLDVLL